MEKSNSKNLKKKPTKQTRSASLGPRRRIVRICVVFVGVAIAVGATAYFYENSIKNENNRDISQNDKSSSIAYEMPEKGFIDKDINDLLKDHSDEFAIASEEVQGVSPDKWDRDVLEKAYVSLLYADKIDDFTKVYSVLAAIEYSRTQGIDIDDNSYGIGQIERDAIRKRADVNASNTLNSVPDEESQ